MRGIANLLTQVTVRALAATTAALALFVLACSSSSGDGGSTTPQSVALALRGA